MLQQCFTLLGLQSTPQLQIDRLLSEPSRIILSMFTTELSSLTCSPSKTGELGVLGGAHRPCQMTRRRRNMDRGPQRNTLRRRPYRPSSSYVMPMSASSVCGATPSRSGSSSAVGAAPRTCNRLLQGFNEWASYLYYPAKGVCSTTTRL